MIKEKVRPKQPSHSAWSQADKNISKTKITFYDAEIIIEMFKLAYTESNINASEIESRKRHVVECNAVLATSILSNFRGVSLKDVGFLFGKHHATIIHYRDLYEESLSKVSECRSLYSTLSNFAYSHQHTFGVESVAITETTNKEDLIVRLKEEVSTLKKKLRYIRKITKIIDN
jgi:hypothetical protein